MNKELSDKGIDNLLRRLFPSHYKETFAPMPKKPATKESSHIKCRTRVFDVFVRQKGLTMGQLADALHYHPVSLSRIRGRYEKEGELPIMFIEKCLAYLYNGRKEDIERIQLMFPDWPLDY